MVSCLFLSDLMLGTVFYGSSCSFFAVATCLFLGVGTDRLVVSEDCIEVFLYSLTSAGSSDNDHRE